MNPPNSHALSEKALDELLKIVPSGNTILEIGTGYSTQRLSNYYKVYSVEHDIKWHTGHSELLHVPLLPIEKIELPEAFNRRFFGIADYWYDPIILEEKLKGKDYEALIVDGPVGGKSRLAMWWFYGQLFKINVPVIVDDVHRQHDWNVAINIGRCKGVKDFKVMYGDGDNNMFAVIV